MRYLIVILLASRVWAQFTFSDVGFVGALTPPVSTYDPNSIYNGMLAWWKMDEASGNRADSTNSNTLTDNGSVPSTNGLVYTNSAWFDGVTSNWLSVGIQETTPFSYAFWMMLNASQDHALAANIVYDSNPNNIGWDLILGSDNVYFRMFDGVGNNNTASASATYDVTNLFVFGYDGTNIWMSKNGGDIGTTAFSGGTTTNRLMFGAGPDNLPPMNGVMGPVGYWGRTLTIDDCTNLWNGGAGRQLF